MIHKPIARCAAIALAALAACGLVAPSANAEDGFLLGAQAAVGRWQQDINAQLLDASGTLKTDAGGSVGVIGQYIRRSSAPAESGYFMGFEASASLENVSETETFMVLGIPATVTGDVSWSADLLWLGGYDFGRISAFFAGGVSFLGNEVTVRVADLTGGDESTHIGWKLGPGVVVDLGARQSLLVRANYGIYQDKTYRDQGVPLDLEPQTFDVRVAWVYRFDAPDLLGFLGR